MENLQISEIERKAAESGIIFSTADKARIREAQRAELDRLEALTPKTAATFADRFNDFYPRLLEALIAVGETVLTFAQTVIVSLGVPVILVLLLIVEHQRVVHGIMLFEADSALAGFAAAALVLSNLVLEFQTHYIEHRAGYEQARAKRWSLRIWSKNMAYRLGIGESWQELELSPASRYKSLLRLVTFTILSLALVGSMRTVIQSTPGAWYEALIAILSESDLLLIMTWAGGLLFALAAVLTAQGLSQYVAIRCVEILAHMNQRKHITTNPHQVEVENAGAVVAMAIMRDKQDKLAAKRKEAVKPVVEVKPLELPLLNGTHYQNGNGHSAN
jgi:hypothetical protein